MLHGKKYRRTVVLGLGITLAATLWFPGPAFGAPSAPAVTLKASAESVEWKRPVTLTGHISPRQPGQIVQIIDAQGLVRAEASTDEKGRYETRVPLRENASLRAQWLTAVSDPVEVGVRARITTKLGRVQLFGRSQIVGSLRPAHPAADVVIRILRNGKRYARYSVPLQDGRFFRKQFHIRRPGSYVALVTFGDEDHAGSHDRSPRRRTRLPTLVPGDRGEYVGILEKRLRHLHYFIRGIDRRYDERTADAVRAFNKVQGRTRLGLVDAGTWRALATPIKARPRIKTKRFHIEVDQTKQVLYTVKKKKITHILHVSTGANGATHDGSFRIYRKLEGYSPGGLYYPSYFDGLRALHGWPEVPTYQASHGCVRLPMWTAQWVHSITPIGTEVYIYH